MSLDSLLRPWHGFAYRHIPHASPYDVLDFRYAASARDNRWNHAGEATLYLAGDPGTALAEFARHLEVNRQSGLGATTVKRSLYRMQVSLARVLDLREEDCIAALSLSDSPHFFLEKSVARATASFVRLTTKAQAILVPSVTALDDLDRYLLVVFLEKLAQLPQLLLQKPRF